ncbi:MAG: response regulator transcription factor [Anaerolineae bacterium]|nr:response regulator transcription factor [Thermoflexales bacterium]MDW8407614.1 response regulator transcription factor [Anaerolineae bacterium]
MSKVLVVEDELTLLELLSQHLRAEGYTVLASANGEEALEIARTQAPDVCVFDVMLPGLDGLSLCRILRKESDVPIILLTARGAEIDRVIGLESGADDYVVKPFSLPELMARVRVALRRAPNRRSASLVAGDLVLDLVSRRVFVEGREVKLSHKEFELLATLMRNKGAVLSREFLITQVWGYDFEGDTRTVDVHVRWLREKIEKDPSKPVHLQTVRGVGYRID